MANVHLHKHNPIIRRVGFAFSKTRHLLLISCLLLMSSATWYYPKNNLKNPVTNLNNNILFGKVFSDSTIYKAGKTFTVPVILSSGGYSPADGATGVTVSSDLVLTFDANIKANTGDIIIRNTTDGSDEFTISINDASQITITNGSPNGVLTINPSSNLKAGKSYRITMPAGTVQATDGSNDDAAAVNNGDWNFTTETVITSSTLTTPASLTNVAKGTNIVITYGDDIQAGTGDVVITPTNPSGTATHISIADVSGQITILNKVLTINPAADLSPNTSYNITLAAGAVQRASDNADVATHTFSFDTGITIASLAPINTGSDVVTTTKPVITFDANVKGGAGRSVDLRNITTGGSSGSLISSVATFSGNTVTFDFGTLNANTEYEIILHTGDIEADGGAGAAPPEVATTAWRFTTASGITGAPTTPIHNATNIAASTTELKITYSGNIAKGASGNITLYDVATPANNQVIDVTTGAVSIASNVVTVTISALTANTLYKVAIDAGAFTAATAPNANVPQLTITEWQFTTSSVITATPATPADNSTDIATTSNLIVNFSAAVQLGTGDIVLTNKNDNSVQNINISTASVSGNQVTIPNTGFTLATDTPYEVTFADGVIVDASGGNGQVAGITTGTNWNFSTVSGITVNTLNPVNNATNVATGATSISITYSANVQANAGNIILKNVTDNTQDDIPVGGANVSISGSVVTITPLTNLIAGKQYEVTIAAGVLQAAASPGANANIPELTSGTWQFTTVSDVVITAPTVNACVGGDYVSIDPIVITEGSSGSFSQANNKTLILTIPGNFELQANTGTVIVNGSEINLDSKNIATNTITIQYDITGTSNINSIVINGLKIKAITAATTADITNSGSGTAIQEGNTSGTKHAGLVSTARPAAPTVNSVTICQGTSQSITATGGSTYKWYSDATLTNLVFTGASPNTSTNLSVNNSTAGVTSFYVTNDNGTCESSATTITVTVAPTPAVSLVSNISGNPIAICSGTSITFIAVASPSGTTYTFNNSNVGSPLQSGSSNTYTSTTNVSGDITVDVTTSDGCTVTSSAITLNVNSLPTVTHTPPSNTNFANTVTTGQDLSDGSSYGGKVSGSFVAANVGTYSGEGVIGSKFYPNAAGAGTHTITYSYTNGNGCTNSTTFDYTVYDPNSAITGLNTTYCLNDGASGTLTPNTSIFPIANRTGVSISGTGITGTGTGPDPYIFTPATAGVGTHLITINVTYSTVPTVLPATVPVTVRALPALTLSNLNSQYCTNITSVTLDPRAGGSSVSSSFEIKYTEPGGSEQSLGANTKTFSPATLATNYGAGTYTMFFTYSDGSCSNTSTPITFNIYALPTPDFTFPSSATTHATCASVTSVTLSPTDGGSAITGTNLTRAEFEIAPNGSSSYTKLGAGVITVNPSTYGTGTYKIRLHYTNGNGCDDYSTDRILTINALPNLDFTFANVSASYCVSETSAGMTPTNNSAAITGTDLTKVIFEIDQGATGSFTVQSAGATTFNPQMLGVGTHQIKFSYTDVNTCSTTSATKTITVMALPSPNFTESNLSYCVDVASATITLRDGATNLTSTQLGSSDVSIQIQKNSTGGFVTPSSGEVTVSGSTVMIHPDKFLVSGVNPHQIQFTFKNANGCIETSAPLNVAVTALPQPVLSISSGLTYCVDATSPTMTLKDNTNTLTSTQLANVTFQIQKNQTGNYIDDNTINVTVDQTNNKVTLNPIALGQGTHNIRFAYKDGNGCSATSADLAVVINALPIPKITGTVSSGYCVNLTAETITLQDNLTTLTAAQLGNVTFQMTSNGNTPFDPLTNNAVVVSSSTVTINPQIMTVGTHVLQYTYQDDNTCSATSASTSITVHALPVPTFTGLNSSKTYCVNANPVSFTPKDNGTVINDLSKVTFSISNDNGVSWNHPTTSIAKDITNNTITFTPATLGTGSYQIRFTYTDGNGCEQTSTPETVTMHALPQPVLTIAGNVLDYCINATSPVLTLQDNVTALTNAQLANVTFQIDKGQTGSYATNNAEITVDQVNNKVTLNPSKLGVGTHNVRFTYVDGSSCTAISNDLAIVIRALPVPTINGIASVGYCVSSTSATISLQDNGTNINISATNVSFTIDLNKTGSFTTPVAGSITPVVGANNVTVNPSLLGVGTHSIKYTYNDGNNCQGTSTSFDIIINALPNLSFTGLNTAKSYCDNVSQVQLTAFDGGSVISGATFKYRPVGTTAYTNFTSSNSFSPATWGAGQYEISLDYTNPVTGCFNTASSPTTVTIEETPKNVKVVVTKDYNKNTAEFSSSANSVLSTWTWGWTFSDGTTNATQNVSKTYTTSAPQLISYSISATTANGCNTTVSKSFKLDFNFSGQCATATTTFTDASQLPSDNIGSWSWDFGDPASGTSNTTSYTTSTNPTHKFSAAGTYWVTLTIVTQDGLATYVLRRRIDIFPEVTVNSSQTYAEDFESGTGGWISHGIVTVDQVGMDSTSWKRQTPKGFNIGTTNGNAWVTDNSDNPNRAATNANYNNNEQSYVESPCFNITGLDRPMISMDFWSDTDQGSDGIVLLYTIDDGTTWYRLGSKGLGIEWYDANAILGSPGSGSSTDNTSNEGWSGNATKAWRTARFSLNEVLVKMFSAGITNKVVRFRMSLGTNSDNPASPNFDGFAFDNVTIGNRNRIVLLEYFINEGVTNAGTLDLAAQNFPGTGNTDEIVSIHHHTSFPTVDSINLQNSKDPSARAFHHGIREVPRGIVDGYTQDTLLGTWATNRYANRTLIISPFNISVAQSTVTGTQLSVNATVTALQSFDRPIVFHVVVVDSIVASNGVNFYNVTRKMLPDAAGTYHNTAWQTSTTKDLSFTWDFGSLSPNGFKVVVFIEDYETKEIYQAGSGTVKVTRNTKVQEEQQATTVTKVSSNNAATLPVKLYPNPATTQLNIDLESPVNKVIHWAVISMNGKVMEQGQWAADKTSHILDVQLLPQGMYLLRMHDGQKEVFRRFEKQ